MSKEMKYFVIGILTSTAAWAFYSFINDILNDAWVKVGIDSSKGQNAATFGVIVLALVIIFRVSWKKIARSMR